MVKVKPVASFFIPSLSAPEQKEVSMRASYLKLIAISLHNKDSNDCPSYLVRQAYRLKSC